MIACSSRLWLVAVVTIALAGCSGKPKPPPSSGVDAQAAGAKAVADLDADKDGKLSDAELKKCPGLQSAVKRLDKDGDGQLSAEEIAGRVQSWLNSGTIVIEAAVQITLDGRALEDADVAFEPEPFLGGGLQSVKGVTNKIGQVMFQASSTSGYPGLYLGFYRVRISKNMGGKELIPAKYNTETELGAEIAADIADRGMIEFNLLSK